MIEIRGNKSFNAALGILITVSLSAPRISFGGVGDYSFRNLRAQAPQDRCESLKDLAARVFGVIKGDACFVLDHGGPTGPFRDAPRRTLDPRSVEALQDFDQLERSIPRISETDYRAWALNTLVFGASMAGVLYANSLAESNNFGDADFVATVTMAFGGISSIGGSMASRESRANATNELNHFLTELNNCFLSELRSKGLAGEAHSLEEVSALLNEARQTRDQAMPAPQNLRQRVRGWFRRTDLTANSSAPPLDCSPQSIATPSVATHSTGIRVVVEAPHHPSRPPVPAPEEAEQDPARPGQGTALGGRLAVCMDHSRSALPLRVPAWVTSMFTSQESVASHQAIPVSECTLAEVRAAALPIYRQAMTSQALATQGLRSMVNEFAAPATIISAGTSGIGAAGIRALSGRLMQGASFRIAVGASSASYVLASSRAGAQGIQQPRLLRSTTSNASSQCVTGQDDFCTALSSLIREAGQACAFSRPMRGVWEYGPAHCADATASLNQALSASACAALPILGE